MPTEVPTPPVWTWLAGCIVHRDLLAGAPEAEVKINGRTFPALLDSLTFHHTNRPVLLCQEGKGGRKDPTSGATDEDGDGAGVGPLAPACQPAWSGQHHPTDP